MANQMIALQARSPQLPDPSRRTAQFVNMMNMAKQQEAAQRQAALAQQTMDINKAQESRAAALQPFAITKAQQDNIVQALEIFREGVADVAEGDLVAAEAVRADLVARVPGWDKVLPPATSWDRNTRYGLMLKAEKEIDKTVATPVASLELSTSGAPRSVTVGGLNPEQRPVYDAPETSAAPRTPTTPAPATAAGDGVTMRATQGSNTTPQDLIDQGMDPAFIPSGSPTSRPISFSQGDMGGAGAVQMTPDVMSRIVDSAFQTGVMAQVDFDQLLATQPPQNKQALVDSFRRANITLQADAPSLADSAMGANPVQTPESQFAVYRGEPMQSQTAGLRGAPPMEQTLAQTRTSTPLQMRNPNVSPAPGVYQVPTQDVAATSRATRPSKQEVFDTELAKIEAARKAGPAPLTPQQKRARQTEVAKAYTQTQSLINKTYDPKEGAIAVARKVKSLSDDQKKAITGFSNYVPSFRESTREADTLIANLKGVVTALGKDAAAASGAIGPMAVQEWKIVADQIANLDLAGMTPRALDAQMDRIIQQVSNATNLAQRVYDVQYSDDVKQYPDFKLKGIPSPRTKTPVVKGGSRISPDVENILKSRGL